MEENLIQDLNAIMMNSEVKEIIDSRRKEFIKNRFGDERVWLTELAYCILVANTSAKSGLKCIEALTKSGKLFNGSTKDIEEILKISGYRYPRKRAEYIFEARGKIKEIKEAIEICELRIRTDPLTAPIYGLILSNALTMISD